MSVYLMARCTMELRHRGQRTVYVEPAAWKSGETWLHGIDMFAQPITLRRSECEPPAPAEEWIATCRACGQQLIGTDHDACACRTPEPERHETVRLFEPAPAVMPGQLGFA